MSIHLDSLEASGDSEEGTDFSFTDDEDYDNYDFSGSGDEGWSSWQFHIKTVISVVDWRNETKETFFFSNTWASFCRVTAFSEGKTSLL